MNYYWNPVLFEKMAKKGRKWNGQKGEMGAFYRKSKPSTTKPRLPIGQSHRRQKMLKAKLCILRNSYHRRRTLRSDVYLLKDTYFT